MKSINVDPPEERTELEGLQDLYSDYHKSLYGFRPRIHSHEDWNSVAYLKQRLAELDAIAPAIAAQEEAREKAAIEGFEQRVSTTIESGAADRATAIRWLVTADIGDDPDLGYFEFKNGLPYGYLAAHP